jgi:galactokinase
MSNDIDELIALLRTGGAVSGALPQGFFAPQRPLIVARAPGRLDVMGGIADYSGSLVLQLPLAEAALVAIQPAEGIGWQVASLPENPHELPRLVTLDSAVVQELLRGDYTAARDRLRDAPSRAWAAYVVGVLLVLSRELGAHVPDSLRVLVRSRVPEAKGVSSSAALEVATMRAACALLSLQIDGTEAARLCQLAENLLVGAPCGIMDQMTSAVGRADELLALLCQPAQVQGFVRLPPAVAVWGIDSGIRHAVSGSDYTSVRCGAFMGYRILADLAGLPAARLDEGGRVQVDDRRWQGYLANVTPQEFAAEFAARLPVKMLGQDFLQHYGGTTDRVTRVEPGRTYAIRQPAAHPVHEHARVQRFRELLERSPETSVLTEMGQLMYASHASYSACGLGSDGTDRLVELVRQSGKSSGLFGAKITGGGSGGTVAVLGWSDAGPAVQDIAQRYAAETGHAVCIFCGSSPGAWNAEVRRLNSLSDE